VELYIVDQFSKNEPMSQSQLTAQSGESSEGKSLARFSFTYRWPLRVAILCLAMAAAITGVASPVFQKIFIDRLLRAETLPSSRMDVHWVTAMQPLVALTSAFFCTLFAQALGLVGNFLSVREGAKLQKVLSEDLYKKTLSIRADSMGSTTIGEVVSLYATDIAGATALIDQVLPMFAMIFFNLACAPVAAYLICGVPMLATVGVMATVTAFTLALAMRQSRFFGLFKQLAAERTGLVNEWIQTIRLLRILGWVESFERKIFAKREEETLNRVAMLTNGQLMNAFGSSINFVLNLVGVASLIYLSHQKVTPGELLAMLWIFGVFLARSFRQIPWFFTFTFDSLTSMRRLERFLARESDAGRVEDAMQTKINHVPAALGVSVRGLNLMIGSKAILRNVNLDLAPGEFVAIVGEVGSGKSSLVLSLVGETGAKFESFKIGTTDIKALSLTERRQFFSFVPQEGFVMTASLRENVVFEYEPGPQGDAVVHHSLQVAQFKLADEIQGPGIDTEIGERGVNMSGGQRQRVSLARAHYFERPIILLDDCLSAVDVDTEKRLLHDLIDGAWRGRTRLLVTHRLSVLNRVDKIFFMEEGRILETGTFDELLKRSIKMQDFVASVRRGEELIDTASSKIEIEAELEVGQDNVATQTIP